MNALRLSWWRLSESWVRMFATSRHWVLAANSVILPCCWLASLRLGPRLYRALHAYDGGGLALLLASLAPCLWILIFSQRLYAMPSRAGSWLTHDFHFLLCLPIPLGRALLSVALVWTLGDLPVVLTTLALLAGFLKAVGATAAQAAAGVALFYWMVFDAFLLLALARLLLHGNRRAARALAAVAVLASLVSLAATSGEAPVEAPELAVAWARHPMPELESAGLLPRVVPSFEPVLSAYRSLEKVLRWFPPYLLFDALERLAGGDGGGWRVCLWLALALACGTLLPPLLAGPLARADRLALVSVAGEVSEEAGGRAKAARRRFTGLDAKELELWRLFWVGPAALAAATAYATWYLLSAGYAILAAAKMLGVATWVVGGLAGDSLGWERRGLRLCQTLPLTPGRILGAKARWAALMGFAALVVPFASVCVLADAEPFAEVLRGTLVLTFLVFVAAHAGVAVGALLRDLSGQGQPGMGAMMGAMLWLGLCVAMVAQVFFTSGYAVYGGLFFDLLLVAALWQRACLRLRWQHEPDDVSNSETAFSDSVVVFLMTYLLVTLIVLKAQAYGAPPGALEALRTYLLSALFPVVLAALSWLHLRRLPAPPSTRSWRGDLAWGAALAALTVGASLAYSYGMTRLGWFERDELASSVRMMRQMVAGLPMSPVLMALLVGGLAPAAEEAFFRGLFYRGVRLLQPHDYRIAVLLSALAFALMHPAAHFPVLFAMGLLLATLVEWRGSLRPAILAHGFHNLAMWTLFTTGGGS